MVIVLECIGGGYLIFVLLRWWLTIKAYGYLPLYNTWQMMRLIIRTINLLDLISGLFAILGILAAVIYRDLFPLILLWLAFSFGVGRVFEIGLPPLALLLGESKAQNISLYFAVKGVISPRKSTHLLNRNSLGRDYKLFIDDNRAIKEPWQFVVAQLMDMAPLIILDVREISGPIVEETMMVLSTNSRIEKTIFIVNPTGESPVFTLLRFLPPIAVHTVTSDDIVPTLRKIISRSPIRLP